MKKIEIKEKLRVNEIKEEKKEVDKQNAKLKVQVINFIGVIHERRHTILDNFANPSSIVMLYSSKAYSLKNI